MEEARRAVEKYSLVGKARTLSIQKDYRDASEVYSEVLETMAREEGEESLAICLVYMEYAQSLLLANEELIVMKKEEIEDLEIAWEVLEIAKQVFEREGARKELLQTYALLSEISLESNNFGQSLEDLGRSLEIAVEEYGESDRRVGEIYFRMAMNYEMLEDRGNTLIFLRKVLEILRGVKEREGGERSGSDIDELIKEMEERVKEAEASPAVEDRTGGSREREREREEPLGPGIGAGGGAGEVIDINHLKLKKDKK